MKLDDDDRPRGILSRADRAYLLGEAEMTHEQSKRNAEARIRERVTNAVLDFNLLVHRLQRKDRRQIFDKSVDDPAFRQGLMAMLAFTYMGLKESGVEFEHVLEPAIRKSEGVYAADALGNQVDVTVTFDVETEVATALDDVSDAIQAGDPVAPAELFAVIMGDESALDDADEVILQLGTDDGEARDEEFVDRLATFLDAGIEELPGNRVRLRVGDAVEQ
ncbi:hypothetical protein ACFQH6_15730 [Halobacteriaceae archaeon GCM10025711]